jgi:hypothetical protein
MRGIAWLKDNQFLVSSIIYSDYLTLFEVNETTLEVSNLGNIKVFSENFTDKF